jgi:hypothetical protein
MSMEDNRAIPLSSYGMYGGMAGILLGGLRGARLSSLRFYLEHQHYKMITKQDWYMYFKMKNYAVMKGFLRQGSWMGMYLGSACIVYGCIEQGVSLAHDHIRTMFSDKDPNQQSPPSSYRLINSLVSIPVFFILCRFIVSKGYSKRISQVWHI